MHANVKCIYSQMKYIFGPVCLKIRLEKRVNRECYPLHKPDIQAHIKIPQVTYISDVPHLQICKWH